MELWGVLEANVNPAFTDLANGNEDLRKHYESRSSKSMKMRVDLIAVEVQTFEKYSIMIISSKQTFTTDFEIISIATPYISVK